MGMKFLVPFLAVAGAITDSGATDFTQGSAADAAALTIAADYMAALGPGPETNPINRDEGFRRINWDPSAASNAGVTQNSGAGAIFPGNFMNHHSHPRARGVVFTTPGSFRLSADPAGHANLGTVASPAVGVNFGTTGKFNVFSANRLLGVFGSTEMDVLFFDPTHQEQRALSNGFGTVFTGNTIAGLTKLDFYDANDELIHTVVAPNSGEGQLSFAGTKFDSDKVGRVRITLGNLAVDKCDQEDAQSDCVAMDDFFYGEPKPIVKSFTAKGAAIADVETTVNDYKAALGPGPETNPVNRDSGFRAINWDPAAASNLGVTQNSGAGAIFPGNFMNFDSHPRARGAMFSSPGQMILSADPAGHANLGSVDSPAVGVNFGTAGKFTVFSANRLIGIFDNGPDGGNTFMDVTFRDPVNPSEVATSNGFGTIFTGNTIAGLTKLEFFDTDDKLIYTLDAPACDNNAELSFAGAKFATPEVARVRIHAGNLGANKCADESDALDCVAMDDFVYGEPIPLSAQPTPAPITASVSIEPQGTINIIAGGTLNVGDIASLEA